MASISPSRDLMAFLLLYFCLQAWAADSNGSFSFKNFGEDSNFTSQLVLYGVAKVDTGSSSIQLSGSGVTGAGRIALKNPIDLGDTGLRKKVSFSMYYVFSLPGKNGGGLAFYMVPGGYLLNPFDERKHQFLAIEFDAFKDDKYGDVNDNHVGVDVDSLVSVKVSNVSSIHLELNSGEKLQAWIDYEASSERFEVRLSNLGADRPVEPLLIYSMDLSKMWEGMDVSVGVSSLSGNSSHSCNIYSLRFELRTVPQWMHSEPLDPNEFMHKGEEVRDSRRNHCALKILTALILGTGFGALGAFFILSVWTVLGKRRPVVPEEYDVQPDESEYKKFSVSADKAGEDGIK
ncbi:L-type lectin-domain containing receptor kinase VIII.2 [Dorcoceras hygrometricum]|uniref:L-type lectin-domain containing receptor kinase VIII.2 n=1 Tax=Dorcoceras hygrometricum TaxID=472368 RepID=A0A2Z7AGZ3_9LAMI|nr:L-type lectin-domain containing receptor kinase VIII.2 [Dorcoceras hygrometricum]